jgi:diguanylate cyclase (GGDEF)-like protein
VLAGAGRRAVPLAVLFLDLDGFKVVNDSLGHGTGDELLVAASRRLAACVRPSDTLARFGGDEFTVLLDRVGEPVDALSVAERLLAALRPPFTVDGREVFVTASIGIAVSIAEDSDPDELLRRSDIALYQAKAAGKARAMLFDPEMNARAKARLELETDLRHALERDELRVEYQPEVDLATGAVVGVEALLRWQHPRRGLLAPDEFIPLAEETGLILSVGEWVFREACRQARAWQAQAPEAPPLLLSVNLSAREFQCKELVEQVGVVLDETGLDPAGVRLEITESAMMHDIETTIGALRALKQLGVQLAIDDFGTGYSSLSYLRRFPVDCVKIDRSFIAALGQDDGTAAIVSAITALARALGVDVTAEGIETAGQLAQLQALGCRRGQGYLFSRSAPSDRISRLLRGGLSLAATTA